MPPSRSRRRCAVAAAALLFAFPAAAEAAPTREFTVSANGSPQGITTGPDANLWFTVNLGHSIGRLTPAGMLDSYNVGFVENNKPDQIVTGPDGALWFTDDFLLGDPAQPSAGVIHRSTTDGTITDFPLPTAAGGNGITTGPDGALWYTMRTPNLVGRITTSGAVTEFPLPGAQHDPGKITTGADGALWFVEPATNSIGRLTTTGVYSEYTPPSAGSRPQGITSGPDGAIWFTEFGTDRIGRIATDGSGTITELPLPGDDAQPNDIIAGPDGALWYSEGFRGHIDRITVLGRSDSYALPGGGVNNLTVGPEGSIWYTRSTNLVGRLETLAPPVVGATVDARSVSGTVLVKAPGSGTFAPLPSDGSVVPVGSELDTTKGRVALTASAGVGTTVTKTADFYEGRFKLSQGRSADAVLKLKLTGPLVGCLTGRRATAASARRGRRVWGNGKGTYQTSGGRSAATVRGTIWLTEDRCDGSTVTTVKEGVVAVRDFGRRKTVLVTAGHSYTAKAKKQG